MRGRIRVAVVVVGALVLAGCSSATQDRGDSSPDARADATKVKVFLNADKVPNVAIFCVTPTEEIGPIAIMSTLSGSDGGQSKASSIIRLAELDVSYCGGKPK